MPAAVRRRGRLYDQAAQFDAQLLARETAAADQMLAAWSESYQGVRQALDQFYAKVAKARAEGTPTSPAWAYQEHRLKDLLETTKAQVGKYSTQASGATRAAQAAAIRDAAVNAPALVQSAVDEIGILATLATADPRALVQSAVGFTGDGTVLSTHLARTLTDETVGGVRSTIIKGLALGKGQDWFVREVTRNYALPHVRAVTIMRTETLRVYRETSRATYEANSNVLEGWTWSAHLDSRTCVACAIMDGTLHAVTESLDGHPRCRCAMVPRTKSWEDLGVPGLGDTRPEIPSGKAWLEGQAPEVQRALMGPRKFDAWKRGEIGLDDMVAQHQSEDWGTMRTERSLKSIQENRNPNPPPRYVADQPTPAAAPSTPAPAPARPTFEPAYVDRLTEQLRTGTLTEDALRKAMTNASDLGRANAEEALTRHARHLADKSAADALAATQTVDLTQESVESLKGRLSTGSMSDRRAAQQELGRRKAAEKAAADAATGSAELPPGGFRPVGWQEAAADGSMSPAAASRAKQIFTWGKHRVHIETDLAADATKALLDDIEAVLKASKPTRPITYQVPVGDRMFQSRTGGLTGGYVTKGIDVVNINPKVAAGEVESLTGTQRAGQFMDSAQASTIRRHIVAHETGHVVDHQAAHIQDAFWNKNNPAELAFFRKWKKALSPYGRTNATEGYAEAYAQWINGGTGSSEVADAYAERYGWKR